MSNIQSLTEVLTSATLAIFQRGDNREQNLSWRSVGLSHLFLYPAGPRDHPDIAESFMHFHAQVG